MKVGEIFTDRRYQALAARLSAVPAVLAACMGSAHAELPSTVTAAITTAGTDLTTAATAVIVAMISFWALRKVGTKMGWW